MKYDWKLDHYQNREAWEQHWMGVPHTEYKSLNENEKTRLQGLNEFLRQLENKFYPLFLAKKRELKARVNDASDWMQEFNLGYVISFHLHDDDAEYEEDEENILMEIVEPVIFEGAEENDWGFGATNVDQAESGRFPGEKHCYLYHQLYDHCFLDWRDLLRIDSVWVDIKIEEQSGILPVNPIGEVIET